MYVEENSTTIHVPLTTTTPPIPREFKTETEYIGPRRAAELLAFNQANRSINKIRVHHYAELMRTGKWDFNGQPINVSRSGRLQNGQHRLKAIIESGVTLPMLVVSGLEDRVQHTMDTGRTRTVNDYFRMQGVKMSTIYSAALKLVNRVEAGWPAGNSIFTIQDALTTEFRHPDLVNHVTFGREAYRHADLMQSVGAAGHYLIARACPDQAAIAEFDAKLLTGENLRDGDPVLALRNWLHRDVFGAHGSGVSDARTRRHMRALADAWNAHRDGRPVQRILIKSAEYLPFR